MIKLRRLSQSLEERWVTPAYAGLLLLGMNLFLFAAAINSMAGWLYVITGIIFGLLLVAAILPPRYLRGLVLERAKLDPVHAGDRLRLTVLLTNATQKPRHNLQVIDPVPRALWSATQREAPQQAIERLPPQETITWQYDLIPPRRGIYEWQQLILRTAAPLGLFWCRRAFPVPQQVVVYPQVLQLQQCPLLDQLGQEISQEWRDRQHHLHVAQEGITRALRPYRWGDPLRLVHWRTSARYGELRVREFDTFSGGNAVTVALDTRPHWSGEDFEQAVIAAASLYLYSLQQKIPVQFWSPATGMLHGQSTVLRELAAIAPCPTLAEYPLDSLVWLTSDWASPDSLPVGSFTVLWGEPPPRRQGGFLWIDRDRPLGMQLQAAVSYILS
ncbi:DUF58 domain-containing protein [Thermosynechococcus sp. HN-54]|uniref:DUF58 domain-containing protein n=1 Tax=Thermosynechococcus sp. HN-54 TaxID=2933959 RepID=UPI00202CB7C7|nr:DUF58 domain-containing protein [Thermosynechococcus sp. HN-54]URR34367.1 DUF58 domain-containing protein [Thermosynechococcus sp. HN-54]